MKTADILQHHIGYAAIGALEEFVRSAFNRMVEPGRIARALCSLMFSGSTSITEELKGYFETHIKKFARRGGGWADPEETAWSVASLSCSASSNCKTLQLGIEWVDRVRNAKGGWGRHPRDQVRIITTALVIALVPEVATEADWNWLRKEWAKDLERPVKLSYKGGFYLLAEKRDVEPSLPDATIRFLENDQNDDGGFGPWKDHPVGSDPWSTGVVLWGLSRWIDRVDRTVIERALDWLERTQLPSGYWPYHYLDEGTSYALIGAVSALKALKRL